MPEASLTELRNQVATLYSKVVTGNGDDSLLVRMSNVENAVDELKSVNEKGWRDLKWFIGIVVALAVALLEADHHLFH